MPQGTSRKRAPRGTPLLVRMLMRVDQHDGSSCWNWNGVRDPGGYGRYTVDHGNKLAHRLMYELLVGPIPKGLTIDHLCRNPPCVNPDHLEPVTNTENIRRGTAATKTHCIHGHEYTPENTHHRPSGGRLCRECSRIYNRKQYWRNKEAQA